MRFFKVSCMFLVSVFTFLFVPLSVVQAQEYNPQHTMLALNMAIVSIHRIITTQDRMVLEQEYQNIINNLSLGNIESDQEIVSLYEELLNFIKSKALRADEENFYRERSKRIKQIRFVNSLPGIVSYAGTNLMNFVVGSVLRQEATSLLKMQQDRGMMTALLNFFYRDNAAIGHLMNFEATSVKETHKETETTVKGELGGEAGGEAGTGGVKVEGKIGGKIGASRTTREGSSSQTSLTWRADVGKYMSDKASARTDFRDRANELKNDYEDSVLHLRAENLFSFTGLIGGLANVCVSTFFSYQSYKADLLDGVEISLWQLKKEDIEDCNRLQTRLLNSSWKLMRRYHLPENYRLLQKNMDFLYQAINDDNPERRIRKLRSIERDFQVYPPYWYYRGQTAFELENSVEGNLCFDKFDEQWLPVLRQDPYKVEVAKYRITELLKEQVAFISEEKRNVVLKQLNIILENIPYSDWANHNFAGLVYFVLGQQDKAFECVNSNLDFGIESDISGLLLKRFAEGHIDINNLAVEFEEIYITRMLNSIQDQKLAAALVVYFNGYHEEAKELLNLLSKTSENPMAFEVQGFIERSSTPTNKKQPVLDNLRGKAFNLRDKFEASYKDIEPVLKYYVSKQKSNAIVLRTWLEYNMNIDAGLKAFLGTQTTLQLLMDYADRNDDFLAEYLLGMLYIKNNMIEEGREYLLKSAKHENFAPAISTLGLIHLYKKDNFTAEKYFKEAAEQGYKPAQKALGDIYYEGGNGLEQNYYQAYKWYQVYEFNDLESHFFSNTVGTLVSNIFGLGGFAMGDETPHQRLDLIEGYGLFNLSKLSKAERKEARDEAQHIIEHIRERNGWSK